MLRNQPSTAHLEEDAPSLGAQKNPAKHLGFTGFSSVGATGFEPATSTSRTKMTTPKNTGVSWHFGNGCSNCCKCQRCLMQLSNELSRCLSANQLDQLRALLGPSPCWGSGLHGPLLRANAVHSCEKVQSTHSQSRRRPRRGSEMECVISLKSPTKRGSCPQPTVFRGSALGRF